MSVRRIPDSPPEDEESESAEEVEFVEVRNNERQPRRTLPADQSDEDEDERDELASNASPEPIRSAVRAFPSHSGTSMRNGRRGAQTHASAVSSRASSKSALQVPSRSSRHSSTSATSSATATAVASTSASASGSKRNKVYHPTWATAPKTATVSADPSAATSRSSSSTPAPQRKRARDRAEVVIPRLPLETLRQYYHGKGTTRITSRYASTEPSDTSDPYEAYSEIESFEDSEDEEEEVHIRRSMARAVKARKGKGRASSDGGDWDDGSSDPLAGSVNGSSEEEEESGSEDMPRSRRKRQTRSRKRRQRNTTYGKSTSRREGKQSSHNHRSRTSSPSEDEQDSEGESEIDELAQSDGDDDGEDEDELDSSEAYASDNSYDSRPKKKKRKTNRGEALWPKESAQEILDKHRTFCEKCLHRPAIELRDAAQKRKNKAKPKKRKEEDEFELDEVEKANALGGWLQCEKCVSSWHWGCLGQHQKDDVLALLLRKEGPAEWGKKRLDVDILESFDFECRKCQNQPACFVCQQTELPTTDAGEHEARVEDGDDDGKDIKHGSAREGAARGKNEEEDDDIIMLDGPSGAPVQLERAGDRNARKNGKGKGKAIEDLRSTLRFRCYRCKQGAHYEHLPKPPRAKDNTEWSVVDRAVYYQNESGEKGQNAWHCHQCREWTSNVDNVIAWRPIAGAETEPNEKDYQPLWKDDLPREYLVRFAGRGFRHWVNHTWLRAMNASRLRTFLLKGPNLDLITDETLAAKGDSMAAPTISAVLQEADEKEAARQSRHAPPAEGKRAKGQWLGEGPGPEVDAMAGLPIEWSTVDRVLDVCLRMPPAKSKSARRNQAATAAAKAQAKAKNPHNRVYSSEPDSEGEPDPLDELIPLPDGLEPDAEDRIEIDTWEKINRRLLDEEDVEEVAKLVTWCFFKWDDLQYDQSTWDTPPPRDSPLYPAFKHALGRYLEARKIVIPILDKKEQEIRDMCVNKRYNPPETQPDCVVGGKLMPFQLNGLQWMLTKHYKRESAILADDMGLGKTVQIASLLGYLGTKKVYPCLVVVPNSTITNWVREFEKWVPHMRVVPYYGEAASRKIIKQYELYHKGKTGKAEGLKAHIVLTTYDMITGHDFNKVYATVPRWEVLCVDEGQRLKSDSSLIFARLRKLNTVHRLLLTGTPLNNNIRELFNLLNFLDPHKFTDREELEKRYAQDVLNEEKILELHEIVKPYILRRIKADVLKLPPKIEIIVPISLSPLQKHLYRLIVDRNVEHIKAVAEARQKKAKAKEIRDKEAAERKRLKEAREQVDKAEELAGHGGDAGASVGRASGAPEEEKGSEKEKEKESSATGDGAGQGRHDVTAADRTDSDEPVVKAA